ncbi:actin-3-like isoform X1 [Bolinopsis microptera]|uniref:actin-3-like isoform X1 n=1 Tax=Bolinopsis microptera TaxID=2820187 RepID=UPI00307912EF
MVAMVTMVAMIDEPDHDGGIIAGLTLPSQRKSLLPLNGTRVLTDKEKEEKKKKMLKILRDELFFSYHVGRCPDEYRFLLTEHVFTTCQQREQIMGLFFEEFKTLGLMFVPQEFLALISSGHTSGIVINMSNTYTSIVPIWNLNILRNKAVVLQVGGQDVTRALELLLKQRRADQVYRTSDFDPLVVEDIKEKRGYVALDYEVEMSKPAALSTEYELPDCQVINLGRELFQCTECLFQPHLFGIKNTQGLIGSVNQLIDTLNGQIKQDIVAQSVFLTGSSSMFPGLVERLRAGIAEKHSAVNVVAPPERKMSAWMGGSIWAELSVSKNLWTTKEEFDAYGPDVVHSKCF